MEEFTRAYQHLLGQTKATIKRSVDREIDTSARLICIRGTRGIGKTTFLLEYARVHFAGDYKRCMYVNLNHFYFATNTLYDFVYQFYIGGGRLMLLDQIFKYPNWEEDILRCYRTFPELQIIFTASTLMDMDKDYPTLREFLVVYDLKGFSFREYLNFHHKLRLPRYTFSDILEHHVEIASEVLNEIHPMSEFHKYLRVGYYPPHMEPALFGEKLVKNINILLEVDMVYIRQIEPTYLHKLRKLLYLIATDPRSVANITLLSKEIGTSRATVMNYLKYLSDAELIRLLYKEGNEYPKKPDRVFVNDTNIASAMYPYQPTDDMLRRTFALSQLENAGYSVHLAKTASLDFVIEEQYPVRLLDLPRRRPSNNTLNLVESLVIGKEQQIPLWLLGFLY